MSETGALYALCALGSYTGTCGRASVDFQLAAWARHRHLRSLPPRTQRRGSGRTARCRAPTLARCLGPLSLDGSGRKRPRIALDGRCIAQYAVARAGRSRRYRAHATNFRHSQSRLTVFPHGPRRSTLKRALSRERGRNERGLCLCSCE